jgi:putative SOS response-associated peptidase YedK
MCGRYSFSAPKEKIKAQLGDIDTGVNLRESFNIAPTQHAYVITNDAPQRLQYITWGLIPHWSNDGKNTGRLINARAEGIAVKPSFRLPIRQRRCLVLADSFYEWRLEGNHKTPYRIFLKNGDLMLLGGIWDIWYHGDYGLKSFSIITTAPNLEIAPVHDRMPLVFSDRTQQELWLSDIPLDQVLSMLLPPEDGLFSMYPVTDMVNSVKNDGPELHNPVMP